MDDLSVAAYEAPRGKICDACRKRSDGAVTFRGPSGRDITLCGTHFDEWLREEPADIVGRERLSLEELAAQFRRLAAFTARLREGRYKACWEAQPQGT